MLSEAKHLFSSFFRFFASLKNSLMKLILTILIVFFLFSCSTEHEFAQRKYFKWRLADKAEQNINAPSDSNKELKYSDRKKIKSTNSDSLGEPVLDNTTANLIHAVPSKIVAIRNEKGSHREIQFREPSVLIQQKDSVLTQVNENEELERQSERSYLFGLLSIVFCLTGLGFATLPLAIFSLRYARLVLRNKTSTEKQKIRSRQGKRMSIFSLFIWSVLMILFCILIIYTLSNMNFQLNLI
jgi:hypothetical protein